MCVYVCVRACVIDQTDLRIRSDSDDMFCDFHPDRVSILPSRKSATITSTSLRAESTAALGGFSLTIWLPGATWSRSRYLS